MTNYVPSKAVHTGRNIDIGKWKDDRFVRCAKCGFINNLDREIHLPEGARGGYGWKYIDITTFDATDIIFDHEEIHFDGNYMKRQVYVGGCKLCGTYLYNK
jgi:hypothetical protein